MENRVPVKVVEVYGFKDEAGTGWCYILFEDEAKRPVRIFVGQCEAGEISHGLQNEVFERPLTYEAMLHCFAVTGATVEGISINDVHGKTFCALVALRVGDKVHQVDMRPSDAVSLVLRAKCPILMNETVIGAALEQ